MEQHYGQLVEKVIRRNGYSISELARLTKVNRRSVYNWFGQKDLKPDIIYRIGSVLNHDFSVEFPNLFVQNDFKVLPNTSRYLKESQIQEGDNNASYWRDKYIALLEKYNDRLTDYVESKSSRYINKTAG